VIGAGAIVRTAHLPAYNRLRFPIAGLFDIRREAAVATARQFGVTSVFDSIENARDVDNAIFDVAVPGSEVAGVLEQLPHGAPVLIQKPMGDDLAGARRILDVCRERRLIAAVNFQLRFSPAMIALNDLLANGHLGELTDIEVRVVDRQPWEQWSFLKGAPRLEVLYHSIHYLDAIRWIAGEPRGVMCRAIAHPALAGFRDTRSSIIVDYGNRIRCSLALNHTHRHDASHRASMLKVEGTSGAAVMTLGVNLEYPCGPPDTMAVSLNGAWNQVPLRGSWFTEAFEGPMSNLQRFVAGEDRQLLSPVDDALKTMAVVEACYSSSAAGATEIPA
jgi:predicted dehydrogenase